MRSEGRTLRWKDHELVADGILVRDVVGGVGVGMVIEEYPIYHLKPRSRKGRRINYA